MTPGTPRMRPTTMGTRTDIREGTIISFCAPAVEMATQLA
jgi:hypothetical protein